MVPSPLKMTVMNLLAKKPMTGYSLMQALEQQVGWKPSPGSVYPLLADLYKAKLVQIKDEGRKKMYSLTPQGRKALKMIVTQKENFLRHLQQHMRACSLIGNQKENEEMKQFFSIIRDKESHLAWLHEDAIGLRNIIFSFADHQLTRTQQEKIKKIIREAIIKLRKIKIPTAASCGVLHPVKK
ncbi:PadR family transcriptional regulator [Candidatus Woesearchaeota archaeon]|nr:PadR family transcriptional regulator [Candidatus Woesearchaeota archaeon]